MLIGRMSIPACGIRRSICALLVRGLLGCDGSLFRERFASSVSLGESDGTSGSNVESVLREINDYRALALLPTVQLDPQSSAARFFHFSLVRPVVRWPETDDRVADRNRDRHVEDEPHHS